MYTQAKEVTNLKQREVMIRILYFVCGFSVAILCLLPQPQEMPLLRKRKVEFRNLLEVRSGSNLDLETYKMIRVTEI
ncbi:MAG: hypothetical protein V2A64_02015 [Candidatus Omnitrophota bacterium]